MLIIWYNNLKSPLSLESSDRPHDTRHSRREIKPIVRTTHICRTFRIQIVNLVNWLPDSITFNSNRNDGSLQKTTIKNLLYDVSDDDIEILLYNAY